MGRIAWLGRRSVPAGTGPDRARGIGSGQASDPTLSLHRLVLRYVAGSIIAAAFAGLIVWGLAIRVGHDLRQEGRRKVAALAATIAASIPAEEHQTLRTRADEALETYRRLRGQLLSIRQANLDVREIYTLIPGEDSGHWHFVLDASADPGGIKHIGDRCPAAGFPEMKLGFAQPSADAGASKAPWGNRISGYAPLRDRMGRAIGVVRVDANANAVLLREREFRQQATGSLFLLVVVIGFVGRDRYQRRRADLDRARNLAARLAIYRVADLLARAGTEEELAGQALDAMAEGTGIAHWALFKRVREDGALQVVESRGLPAEARAELSPDPLGPDAESPVSRAAWLGEPVVARDPSDAPSYRFASAMPDLGAKPVVVALPLGDRRETIAVLQGFVPRGRSFGGEDLALCRWMASQISTGLRRLQLELRDQLLASFMVSSGEIVLGLSRDCSVSYMNPAGERALGIPSHDLAGRPIDQLFTLSETGEAPLLSETIRPSGSYAGELWCRRADGTRFPMEVTVSPAIDRDGNQVALVLVGRDVTERRERDQELRSRSEQLLLLNEQLQQANAALEEGNRMKNQFLASTSHELRTPLNAVIGFATLLEQDMQSTAEEGKGFARSIRESAEHLLKVINDILDLAKVEAGRFELMLHVEDVSPLIQATAAVLRQTAQRKGLTVRVDVPRDPLPMRLDEARMRQVLLNLLGNAIKFTDNGEVRVTASRPAHGNDIAIVIEDTGIGIDPVHLPKLFTKFTQVDGSYKRRHQGTGLGLAITQSLVEKMGGTIAIWSEGLGRGTRLTLTFPAAGATSEATPARSAGETIPAGPGEDRGGKG